MNQSQKHFTWVPLYKELAGKLTAWKDRQTELIQLLESIREKGFTVTPLSDKDGSDGERFLIKEIDPFTFMGSFNRGIRTEHRIGILTEMKKFFDCDSELPVDFDGIPILNNQRSWLVAYQHKRNIDDVKKLWNVFTLALTENPLANADFMHAYDDALKVKGVNVNLSMGLFWIRPDVFLNLDNTNRKYLKVDAKAHLTAANYKQTLEQIKAKYSEPFVQISCDAYLDRNGDRGGTDPPPVISNAESYWLVGASWEGVDQTEQFLANGIWANGYKDGRYADHVNDMKVGERIAIKSTFTQRHGLPFEADDRTVSKMQIKARGTIVKNHEDGRTVEVEWDPDFGSKDWYFFTYQKTIWKLQLRDDYQFKEYGEKLIRFVFFDEPQDYKWFCEKWYEGDSVDGGGSRGTPLTPYGIDDIIAEGVFLDRSELEQIVERLKEKKNLILQGAPGVGKTFLAEKLAFALMQEADKTRVKFVQFHQSYSYEDFVRGYRPLEEKQGTFGIQDGIFFNFCEQARNDERVHVMIIDEINRGNLSQIFGELLMLIENDKRKEKYAVPLMYKKPDEADFYVPDNLYIIGMMNLADRSLALVDYALRRRFAFKTLLPKFESELFADWLSRRSMNADLIDLIVDRLTALNRTISDDEMLGENYAVGHSYFCPNEQDLSSKDRSWYDSIIETEIVPLLKEYWFDNKDKQDDARKKLVLS